MNPRYASMLALVAEGIPQHKIAKRLKCSRSLVSYVLRKGAAVETMKPRDEAAKAFTRWSARDDAQLRLAWGSGTIEETAAKLGRSPKTTYWRAQKLGLTSRIPQGFEGLNDAAKRAGFTTTQLRAILHFASVGGAHRRPCRTYWKARGFAMVVPDAVDEAVALWAAAESVSSAAERRGMCDETLRRWLIADGQTPPKRFKAMWRIASDVINRVIADHQSKAAVTASVRAHAARVGLSKITLAKRLRAAGVLGPKRPGVEVRLRADVVDAALRGAA